MSLQAEIDCQVYGECVNSASPLQLTDMQSFFMYFISILFCILKLVAFFTESPLFLVIFFSVRLCIILITSCLSSPLRFIFIIIFVSCELYPLFSYLYFPLKSCFFKLINKTKASQVSFKKISVEEFNRQSAVFTLEELAKLRNFVKSPDCNQFDVVLRLKNPKQFASAVESNEMNDAANIVDFDDDASISSSKTI